MIFFYIGYWFLTQRQSLGRSLLFVGSIELARIVFAGVLRSNTDPMFDDSRFLEMLAFNVGIFVPLALVFVCVVHFGGKLWKRLRSKKVEQATEEVKPVEAVPVVEKVVPDAQSITSTPKPEPEVTSQKATESKEERQEPRKLDGVMRLRIVGAVLAFLGSAAFASSAVFDYLDWRDRAETELGLQQRLMNKFLADTEIQKKCEADEEFFSINPPSHLREDVVDRPFMERITIHEELKKSLSNVQQELFKCDLVLGHQEDCEAYEIFQDLYRSCIQRKEERERNIESKKLECASLNEQEVQLQEQIDLNERYDEHSQICSYPYTRLRLAEEHMEDVQNEMGTTFLLAAATALIGTAIFWGIGSVVGWVIRGFRQ